jgi:putative PIN family toxin of toxin-antitoxin system
VLYELQAVLSREKFRRYLTIAEVREYLLWIRDRVVIVEIAGEDVVVGATPDYLIAVAIGSAAEILVSGDSHLLDLEADMTSGVSTTIITPHEFLRQIKRSG